MGGRGGGRSAELAIRHFAVVADQYALLSWSIEPSESASAGTRYTSAERAVLALLVGGASNAEIARARGSSPRTVANQVASLLRKSGKSSRLELIASIVGI